MHLTIVSGMFLVEGALGVTVFLGLKTVADVLMHAVEHGQALIRGTEEDAAKPSAHTEQRSR